MFLLNNPQRNGKCDNHGNDDDRIRRPSTTLNPAPHVEKKQQIVCKRSQAGCLSLSPSVFVTTLIQLCNLFCLCTPTRFVCVCVCVCVYRESEREIDNTRIFKYRQHALGLY